MRRLNQPETAVATLDDTMNAVGDFKRQENLTPAAGVGVPWIGFYNKKAGRASEIIKALGAVGEGCPYVCVGENYYDLTSAAFVIIDEFPYWAVADESNELTHVWETPQPFGAKVGKKGKVKDCLNTLTLILPGAGPLAKEIQPALVTVSDFRGTKVKAGKRHLDAVEETTTTEWVRANGEIAGAVPPRFRVASSFKISPKTGRSGFAYALADSVSAPMSVSQLAALQAWWKDEECREALTLAEETLQRRCAWLREIAEDTEAL